MSDQTAGPEQTPYPVGTPQQYAPPAAPTPQQYAPPATATPEQYAPAAEQYAPPAPPAPEQYAPSVPATPQQQAPAAPAAPATPTYDAQHAWIDGYEPGNPWQSRLCFQTQFGTVSYPLTPNTMPELLEGLVMVAQEQQGITGDLDPADDEPDATSTPTWVHDGRAARLTGWAMVHDLWEREDPKARYVMGGVVAALLLLGIFLT
ncbi:hypothetical protein ACFUJR_12640 [Streptomyces sp. NPDC057271]|uniref:hypothetical protein n=1 Tax=unclassified Streptomyces TaxID=2593676 RepID=UPI00362718E5